MGIPDNPLGRSKVAKYVYHKDKDVMLARLVEIVEAQRKRLEALEKIVESLDVKPSEDDVLFDEDEVFKVKLTGDVLIVKDFHYGHELGKVSATEVRYMEIGNRRFYYPKARPIIGIKDKTKMEQKDALIWDTFGKY